MTRMQRGPGAITLLELGVEATPRSTAAHNDLGNGLLQAADTARAIQSFEQALIVLPADSAMTVPDRAQSRTVLEQKIARLRGRRP